MFRLSPTALAGAPDAPLAPPPRAGDGAASPAIVDRSRAPPARHCRRYLAPASAEDALQQTFINAHAAITGETLPLALKPWLYRIARNVALNIARGESAV